MTHHHVRVVPSPHPENQLRTLTIIVNIACPRCGRSLAGLDLEPDDLFHCPHCKGGLDACARLESGGEDRTANIVSILWVAPTGFEPPAGDGCECVGCVSCKPSEEP